VLFNSSGQSDAKPVWEWPGALQKWYQPLKFLFIAETGYPSPWASACPPCAQSRLALSWQSISTAAHGPGQQLRSGTHLHTVSTAGLLQPSNWRATVACGDAFCGSETLCHTGNTVCRFSVVLANLPSILALWHVKASCL
jgi:hypothetical protein